MIKQTIDQDLKVAMLAGEKELVSALRTLKGAILDAEISSGKREVGQTDQEVITLLQKELKKRAEAATMYVQGGNEESAAAENFEAVVIQKYLPKQLDEAEIGQLIEAAIAEFDGEVTMQGMDKLISAVKDKSGGAADGALVARLVKARLSQ